MNSRSGLSSPMSPQEIIDDVVIYVDGVPIDPARLTFPEPLPPPIVIELREEEAPDDGEASERGLEIDAEFE